MSYTHNNDVEVLECVQHYQEKIQESRREFFKLLGTGVAATAFGGAAIMNSVSTMIGDAKAQSIGADGWKSLFNINPNMIYMNIGTTGSTPTSIVANYDKLYRESAKTPQNYWYPSSRPYREQISAGFGAHPNEIVMSFNTSDGFMRAFEGLEWKKDDVIITTWQEHPAGWSTMTYVQNLYNVKIVAISLVSGVNKGEALIGGDEATGIGYKKDDPDFATKTTIARLEKAYQKAKSMGNPKALFFSSPPYVTGTRLPEKEICAWAASKNLTSIVDGAHLVGMANVNLHDMGCDFFTGSGHKWQCGPGQSGIFYRRNGKKGDPLELSGFYNPPYANANDVPVFWPTSDYYNIQASAPFVDGRCKNTDDAAGIISSIGNGSYPILTTLRDVCVLWDKIGRENIEKYTVSISQYLKNKIGQSVLMNVGGTGAAVVNDPTCLSVDYRNASGNAWLASDNIPVYLRSGMTTFAPAYIDNEEADYNNTLEGPASILAGYTNATKRYAAINKAISAVNSKVAALSGASIRVRISPQQIRSDATGLASGYSFDYPYLDKPAGTLKSAMPSFRVTTHLFNTVDQVNKLIDAFHHPDTVPLYKGTVEA